jgi:hypothetical protein
MYPKFMISGQQLCNSDKNLPLEIKFFNRHGTENIYLGSCKVTIQDMLIRREFDLQNFETRAQAGRLQVEYINLVEKPSFIDYLRSGWQINLHVAIDFTASNGESSMPNSLHYLNEFN